MSVPQVKVEVAIASTPDVTDVWTDVSAWVLMAPTIKWGRGLKDEQAQLTAHAAGFVLDNQDLRFTPGNASSPYAPNTKYLGHKVRVSLIVNATTYTRFTGYVDGWTPSYPGGNVRQVIVTAADRVNRDNRRKMGTYGTEYIREKGLHAYWAVSEDSRDDLLGSTSGTHFPTSLAVVPVGAGRGSVEFGNGADFRPESVDVGKALEGLIRVPVGEDVLGQGLMLGCFFTSTTTGAEQMIARVDDGFGNYTEIGLTSAGAPYCEEGMRVGGGTETWRKVHSFGNQANGQRHWLLGVIRRESAGNVSVRVWIEEVQEWLDVGANAIPTILPKSRVMAGGARGIGKCFTGTISNLVITQTPPSDVTIQLMIRALRKGGDGEVGTNVRKIFSFHGIAGTELVTPDFCQLVNMSPRPTEGLGAAEYASLAFIDDEGGRLFVDGNGKYVGHNRTRRYTHSRDALVATVPARYIEGGKLDIQYDTGDLINEATVSRPTSGTVGSGVRVADDASITEHGRRARDVKMASPLSDDLLARAGWEAYRNSVPRDRVRTLPIDLLTMTVAETQTMLGATVGDVIKVTELPDDPDGRVFVIEGWTETVSLTSWVMDCVVTDPEGDRTFHLDNGIRSIVDADNYLAH